jgi:ParB/RepB/Spo0J family partition protein
MTQAQTKKVDWLPPKKLHRAPFHKRSRWRLDDITPSVKSDGIILPLKVRKRSDGEFEIVSGNRRQSAAIKVGLELVPCIVVDIDDIDAIAQQLIENTDREDLHPMDVAEYYDELERMGVSPKEIARRFRKKERDIRRALLLMGLGTQARKAFVEDKIDEEAALALARLSDEAKQRDVIAAVSAGHLQPEEIPGYVRRMFTAALDDVPWVLSDPTMPGGACTVCPMRSDVQKDMFSDGPAGSRCLNVDCHRTKMARSFEIESQRPGISISSEPTDALFTLTAAARPSVMKSSGMVDAEARCPMIDGLSWREAIGRVLKPDTEKPSEYLARDQDGRPRWLYREAVVARLVRKSDAVRDAREVDAPPAATDSAAATAAASARAENKLRRQVVADLAKKVTTADQETWGWVTARIIDGVTARSAGAAAALLEDHIKAMTEIGVDPNNPKACLTKLAQESNRQARRVATAILVFEEADTVSQITPAIQELADACGIDIGALEAEIRSKT